MSALWVKVILNAAYNALSAITQLPYGKLVQGEHIPAVMRDIVDECLAVARASGIALTKALSKDLAADATVGLDVLGSVDPGGGSTPAPRRRPDGSPQGSAG